MIIYSNNMANERMDYSAQKILSVMEKVSTKKIEFYLNNLTQFHTRHIKSKYIEDAAEWIFTELRKIGYQDVFYHKFNEIVDNERLELKNIVCNKRGKSDKVIMICAHYDSRTENLQDSFSRAPGANDDASGVSAVMEIARVLLNEKLECSLQFVLFSGEEHNLIGSKKYVQYIKKNGIDLYRLINLDMVGNPYLASRTIIIERDDNLNYHHNKIKENDDKSIEFSKIMEDMVPYTDLQFRLDSIYDSDYEPFEENGYVVLGVYDGSAVTKNPNYHSSSDLPMIIDWSYLTSVTKLVLATILKVSDPQCNKK